MLTAAQAESNGWRRNCESCPAHKRPERTKPHNCEPAANDCSNKSPWESSSAANWRSEVRLEELQAQLDAAKAGQAAGSEARIEAGKLEQELRCGEALLAEAQARQEACRVELAAASSSCRTRRRIGPGSRAARRTAARGGRPGRCASTDSDGSSGDGELARMREALDAAHLENHLLVGRLSQTPAEADTEELKKLRKDATP